ncbi:MAG: hypothetical protein WB626_00920 [Bacteroidota bacterium]
MKNLSLAAILLLAISIAQSQERPRDVEEVRDFSWGTTFAMIAQHFAGDERFEALGNKNRPEYSCIYRDDEILDTHADVFFRFINDSLQSISLGFPEYSDPEPNDRLFSRVEGAMVAKYGRPNEESKYGEERCKWVFKSTTIRPQSIATLKFYTGLPIYHIRVDYESTRYVKQKRTEQLDEEERAKEISKQRKQGLIEEGKKQNKKF